MLAAPPCNGTDRALRIELTPGPVDFFRQHALLRQGRPVLGGEYFVGETFERVIQIEMHLPRIRMREFAEFEINDDEASEQPVKKQEVDPVPLISNAQGHVPDA